MNLLRCRSLYTALDAVRRNGNGAKQAAQTAFEEILTDRKFSEPRLDWMLKADLSTIAFEYVQWLVWERRRLEAATVLWPSRLFTGEPRSVQRIWSALSDHDFINLLGGSSLGKSFSPLAFFLLEFIADPDGTRVDLVSTDEQKLKSSVFSKVVILHHGASLVLPGVAKAETLSLDPKMGFGFYCRLIKRGDQESATLKGTHRVGREVPHHVYGNSSRRFVLLDEAQQISENAFRQIPNVLASGGDEHKGQVKVVMNANPTDMASLYGLNSRPKEGWSYADDHDEWISMTGAFCVSLDVRQSENFIEGKTIFDNFATRKSYSDMLAQCGGDEQHPDMFTFCYGMFPPNGPYSTLISNLWIDRSRREWIFDGPTTAVAGEDPALTGDEPAFAFGRAGHAVAFRNEQGVEVKLEQPGFRLQVDGVVALQRGDSQEVANAYMEHAAQLHLRPENIAADATGTTAGVVDIQAWQWPEKAGGVRGKRQARASLICVVASESASTRKISEEDSQTPRDLYRNRATELWYACAKFHELEIVAYGLAVPSDVFEQLTTRKGGRAGEKGAKLAIESKQQHKSRLKGKSPDKADAVCHLVHAARMSVPGFVIKQADTVIALPPRERVMQPTYEERGMKIQPVSMTGWDAAPNLEEIAAEPVAAHRQEVGLDDFLSGWGGDEEI